LGTMAECLRDKLCIIHSKIMNRAWICHELSCRSTFVQEGYYHHTVYGLYALESELEPSRFCYQGSYDWL
jgi:hypothetical protein